MTRTKLTVFVDEAVIARAQAYSEAHGTSTSQLVTDFLASLPRPGGEQHAVYTPTVRRLLGLLPSEIELDGYQWHLDEEYAG